MGDKMPVKQLERLETRIGKDLKKSLRLFCAMNDMTIQDGVEMALKNLLSEKPVKVKQVKANSA